METTALVIYPEYNQTDNTETKCTKKTKVTSIFITLLVIAIASTVVALIMTNNMKSNRNHPEQPALMKATFATMYVNYTQSVDSRFCMNATQCANQNIIANNIFCFNSGTCSYSKLISLSSGSINCISDKSCYSANLLVANTSDSKINCFGYKSCMRIANGVKTLGNLYCKGLKSCYNLNASIHAKYVECSGEQSCAADGMDHIVYNAEIMNCSGKWSCSNSIIYAKQVHVHSDTYPIKNTEIIAENIYLYKDLSGSFGNIKCKNESICNVYCYVQKACENLNVFVNSNKTTLSVDCDGVICPNVWYIDESNEVSGKIEFDNTQLFRDNHGFVLNDEMFDVGRDWILNGNFNLNIVIQDYQRENELKDDENDNAFYMNSNIKQLLNTTSLSLVNDSYNNQDIVLNNEFEFDNTQLFRDNTGFILNDEMFDVGQDWKSKGNFNMNITFQNYGHTEDNKDTNNTNNNKRLLDISSLQL